jgi:hypothetical protein
MALQPWEDIEEDATLIDRLQSWLMKQPDIQAKITDAAAHFNVKPDRIRQAAQDGYWLGTIMHRDGEYVFAEGE